MSPRLLLPAMGILLFCSCSNDTDGLFPDPLNPSQELFKSSIFLSVRDASGTPISEAEVRIGGSTAQTDENGFVHFDMIRLGKSSYLTIEKDGFFHASRRFYPTASTAENIHVTLLPISRKAFFPSASGGNFVDDGLRITFPANGYVFPNGNPYNGTVLVYSTSIKADDPDLSFKMPGDLVGIMGDGSNVALASMGMFAVELRTNNGELLELKEGVSAEVQMDVPSSLTNLPANIPLWHFDELSGVWREEGQAILSGNSYIGSVSHFSYWNYDAWFPIVKWGVQIQYATPDRNDPAIYAQVCITILSMNVKKCAITNSDGFVCGMVAANELLQLDIYGSCGELEYSEIIGPFSDTTMMLPVIIDAPQASTITGLGVDCDGNPINNGYAIINNGVDFYVPLEDGVFSTTFNSCNELPFSVSVVDATNVKSSVTSIFEPSAFVDTDTIFACQGLSEYVILNVEGYADQIVFAGIEFRDTEDGYFLRTPLDSNDNHVSFKLEPNHSGYYFSTSVHINVSVGGYIYSTDSVNIKIESFGNVGEYIYGKIYGTLDRWQGGLVPQYNFTGSFSVLRDE